MKWSTKEQLEVTKIIKPSALGPNLAAATLTVLWNCLKHDSSYF